MLFKYEVQNFNVWTIIMQFLNIKEWKLFEKQITQTRRYPKYVVGGQTDERADWQTNGVDPLQDLLSLKRRR